MNELRQCTYTPLRGVGSIPDCIIIKKRGARHEALLLESLPFRHVLFIHRLYEQTADNKDKAH
jgi:hypothetical protein